MNDLKFHPLCTAFFPPMGKEALNELAADIKEHGQRAPINLLDGKILDGRNRYLACKIAGVEPKTKEYTGKDPFGFVVSVNFKRRQLTQKERAETALKISNYKHGGDRKAPNGAPKITQTAAAKIAGVSRRTLQRVKAEKGPAKPAKSSKPREPGWTPEQLAKDQELSDHFSMIEAVYGAQDTNHLRQGTINLSRADVLYLGKLPKERMLSIQDLMFETHWTPKHCIEFLNTDLSTKSTIEDLINLCLTTKGKYWQGLFGGFTVTVKNNQAAKR